MSPLYQNTPNRHSWEFEYPASTISEAAKRKREHHAARLDWWKNKQDEVINEVRANGLEVSESVSSLYASSMAPQGAQLIVKNEYQNKLNECHQKIQKHAELISEYDGWAEVLASNGEAKLKLKQADWLFFFGSK